MRHGSGASNLCPGRGAAECVAIIDNALPVTDVDGGRKERRCGAPATTVKIGEICYFEIPIDRPTHKVPESFLANRTQ